MNDNNNNNKREADGEQIVEKLFRLMRLMHRRNHRIGGEFFADGVQRGQGRILAMLQMKPDMTQKELSYLLNIRNQSLGELLAKLEKKEYIVRTPSDEDKRMMRVSLTDKGRDAAKRVQNRSYGLLKIFEALNADEARIFSTVLDKLISELEAEAQNDDDLDSDAVTALKKVGKFFRDPFVKVFKGGFAFSESDDEDGDADGDEDDADNDVVITDTEDDDGTVIRIEKSVGEDGKKIKKIKINKKVIKTQIDDGGAGDDKRKFIIGKPIIIKAGNEEDEEEDI